MSNVRNTRDIENIIIDLEVNGYMKGTPEFEKKFIAAKVEKCKELRSVNSCVDCSYFMECQLIKTYLQQLRNE